MTSRSKNINALKLKGRKWTPHDLRRTGATMMGVLGVRADVIEKCLNQFEQNKMSVYLYGYDPQSLQAYGQKMRQTIMSNLGIPVCVGIAAKKTMAKLANHCAKKGFAGTDGVCDFGLLDEGQLSALFSSMPSSEIWGVGRRITEAADDEDQDC